MRSREGDPGLELEWLREFTPATRAAADSLPPLEGERLLVVCHLDVKMIPYFEALLAAEAEVWACGANPATTRDPVAEHLEALGVRAPARALDPRSGTPTTCGARSPPAPPSSRRWAPTQRSPPEADSRASAAAWRLPGPE